MKKLLLFVPFAFILSVSIFVSYLFVQQQYRADANDPQVQIAHDFAYTLSHVNDITNAEGVAGLFNKTFGTDGVAIDTSMRSFGFIFDASGKAIASNAVLNGSVPSMPIGVLTAADKDPARGNRVTWQPQQGVRIALVVYPFTSEKGQHGYVVVGRSLGEVERREDVLTNLAILAWLGGMLGLGSVMLGGMVVHKMIDAKEVHEAEMYPKS